MGLIYISTSSRKKRAKKKPTKVERENNQSWEALVQKYSGPQFGPKYGTKNKKLQSQGSKTELSLNRVSPTIKPQEGKLHHGSTAKPQQKVYTGTKVLGVATMHKSNMVPIFSEEEAVDVATMRRN